MDWTDWIGLDWIGLDWIGWIGSEPWTFWARFPRDVDVGVELFLVFCWGRGSEIGLGKNMEME